jgi:uncharacterized protein (DUF952 family)
MTNKLIYHITTPELWEKQQNQDFYEAESLKIEGFIHCSTKEQVAGVLERYFKGVSEILLLHLAVEKLTATLKYEVATASELFPHIFGTINKDAIIEVEQIFL